MFGRYSYTLNNPVNFTDPDGRCVPPITIACVVVAAEKALVATTVLLTAAAVGEQIGNAQNEANNEDSGGKLGAHDPRPLTEEEKQKLSDAGKQKDKGDRTKAGRAGEKHGSRPGSAFPPTSGDADSVNDQGQEELDGILEDEGSTIEVDDRGRTTVTAPDGKAARFNPDGSMQGFREPETPNQDE
jgi:hypothetical protein